MKSRLSDGKSTFQRTVLEFLNNLWAIGTEDRNRVVVPTRQATHYSTQPGGIGSLKSILGLLKSLKIWALCTHHALEFRSGEKEN
jgi:hypothetical protein